MAIETMTPKITLRLPLPPPELSPNARGRWERIEATTQYRADVILSVIEQAAKWPDHLPREGARYRITETYRIAGRRKRDVRNLFAAFKAAEDALGPPRRTNRNGWVAGASLIPGDDDSVLEHGAPRIERVETKAEECVIVVIEDITGDL